MVKNTARFSDEEESLVDLADCHYDDKMDGMEGVAGDIFVINDGKSGVNFEES